MRQPPVRVILVALISLTFEIRMTYNHNVTISFICFQNFTNQLKEIGKVMEMV